MCANDEIKLFLWRYEESHVAENSGAFLVIPSQVDRSLRSEFIASNASGTFLFVLGQWSEVLFGKLEDIEYEIS